MKVDIYLREVNGDREIRIPWLPDEIPFDTGEAAMASYDILNKGEVVIPTGVGLTTYSWESLFPGKGRKDDALQRGRWNKPSTYHDTLTYWKENRVKLNLLVTGYPINMTVYVRKYNGTISGGFGDIPYSIELIEARDIVISSSVIKKPEKRPSPKQDTSTYVVKSGDTLWAIAEKILGSGSLWETIYDANKEIIESTATERWKAAGKDRDSEHGKWIFPGTKLFICYW